MYVCANQDSNNDKSLDDNQRQRVVKVNKYGLYGSVVVMLGLASVTAFRPTEHYAIHMVFALTAIIAYCLCVAIQTWISYQMVPTVNSLTMARFRLVIAILINASAVLSILVGVLSQLQVKVAERQVSSPARLLWDESWGRILRARCQCCGRKLCHLYGLSILRFFCSWVHENSSQHWKV